jgi:predicted amidohydrolase YtcJ
LLGVVLDRAQDLMARMPLTDEVLSKRFAIAVKDATAVGLTSIHDAGLKSVSLDFFKRWTFIIF